MEFASPSGGPVGDFLPRGVAIDHATAVPLRSAPRKEGLG